MKRHRFIYPEARRVLLTAYADTEAAIRAINSARIHYFLNKPWDPPEEKLYPALDDMLEDWQAGYTPPFEGLRVIGDRWSLRDHEIRNFLSRNHIPYRWLDAVSHPEALEAARRTGISTRIGCRSLFLADGSAMVEPTPDELAARVGLSVQATQDFYDLVVVGAGPAGLAAAVYGASEGLKTLVVEPEAPGGQAGSTSLIENYLGFPSGLTGGDLARRAHVQASRFGAEFVLRRAAGLRIDGQYRFVQTADGREVATHAVLLASGVQYRKLQIPDADRFTGRGIYYGAALVEAVACKGEEVLIVGGANSAGQAAMHFSRYAGKVTLLVRGPGLSATMSKYLIDEIGRTSNISVATSTEVVGALGDERLTSVRLRTPEGESEVAASSLFVFIGASPRTSWLPACVQRDDTGFVLAGPDLRMDGKSPEGWKEQRPPYLLESSVPGVFVAGDVRHGSVKRVASAVGEGSIAVQFVHQYLAGF